MVTHGFRSSLNHRGTAATRAVAEAGRFSLIQKGAQDCGYAVLQVARGGLARDGYDLGW
jgi:hypothetical protein